MSRSPSLKAEIRLAFKRSGIATILFATVRPRVAKAAAVGKAAGSSALKNVSILLLTGLSLSNVHGCSDEPMRRSVDYQTSGPNVSAGAPYAGVKSAATW